MFRRESQSDTDELPDLVIWFPETGGGDEGSPRPESYESLRLGDGGLATALDHLKEPRATRGFRPGGNGDVPDRRGGRGEIVTPVLVRPALASALAVAGVLFSPSPHGLAVDGESLEHSRETLTWQVTLRLGLLFRRRATLRLQPSPSANLTVLEVVPNKPIRIHQRAFLRVGIQAMDEVAERLVSASVRPSS